MGWVLDYLFADNNPFGGFMSIRRGEYQDINTFINRIGIDPNVVGSGIGRHHHLHDEDTCHVNDTDLNLLRNESGVLYREFIDDRVRKHGYFG